MKRSQKLPDFWSPISEFQYIHFIDTVTDIDRSFGVPMLYVCMYGVAIWCSVRCRLVCSIQTFSEVRSLDVTW